MKGTAGIATPVDLFDMEAGQDSITWAGTYPNFGLFNLGCAIREAAL